MTEKFIIYDEEHYVGFSSYYFIDFKTDREKYFIIHKSRNDIQELYKFFRAIKKHEYILVGFNSLKYDAQMDEYLFKNRKLFLRSEGEFVAEKLRDWSDRTLSFRTPQEQFENLIPEWRLNFSHLDLFRQQHYDRKEKATSLKWLEFTMRSPNISSFKIGNQIVTEEMIPKVIAYNRNDVLNTKEFFKRIFFETELRLKLSKKYDLNLLNAPEPRMARDIFGKFLAPAMGVNYRDLKKQRTYRSSINVAKDKIIFPYIKFKSEILKAAKNFYESLEFNPYKFEQNNLGLKTVEKTFKFHNIPEITIGLGGIHGCASPGIYTSDKKWVIRDIDGSSYYPNLGIQNDLYPEHLSYQFCITYKELYDLRQALDKLDPENVIFKLILNTAYGLSKQPDNYFHDPKYTFSITINGQLLLLMMAEIFKYKVPGVLFYQFNTDGVTIGYDPVHEKEVKECMSIWERITKIKLEDKFYTKMVIRDVNNYMAMDTKGKVKRKGAAFIYSLDPEDKELYYHKNPSELVVPKALEAYFFKGISYEKFIRDCTDIYDFCAGVKVKSDFDLKLHYLEDGEVKNRVIEEQVVRYYVSTENTSLKKHYRPGSLRYKSVDAREAEGTTSKKKATGIVELRAKVNTTPFNTYVEKSMKDYNINYNYYITKARGIVSVIEPFGTMGEINFEK